MSLLQPVDAGEHMPVDLSDLNPEQLAAVEYGAGPLLVYAGAGSGKTRVLTTRVAHLVERRGVDPSAVLAITFTNKAAREMKDRLGKMLGPVAKDMWVSTFHSACLKMIRPHASSRRTKAFVHHLRHRRLEEAPS